jgi:hypothetical protein
MFGIFISIFGIDFFRKSRGSNAPLFQWEIWIFTFYSSRKLIEQLNNNWLLRDAKNIIYQEVRWSVIYLLGFK